MLQADIHHGHQYGVCGDRGTHGRVAVVGRPRAGAVQVRAEEAVRYQGALHRAGSTLTVRTRDVADWDECVAAEAHRQELVRLAAEEAAPRWDRPVRGPHDKWLAGAPYELYRTIIRGGAGGADAVRDMDELWRHLPSPARRDLAAAIQGTEQGLAPPPGGTVGAVLGRAVAAAGALAARHATLRPDTTVAGYDDEFVAACVERAGQTHGALVVPFVPRVAQGQEGEVTAVRPVLGWVRVSAAEGSRRLHRRGACTGGWRGDDGAGGRTLPRWWAEAADADCAVCGGGGIPVTPTWVRFRLASDLWSVDRGEPEGWQCAAAVALLGEAAAGRAQVGEVDTLVAAEVLEALADDLPGEEGWYGAAMAGYRTTRVPDDHVVAAAQLATARLEVARSALPAALRPQWGPYDPGRETRPRSWELVERVGSVGRAGRVPGLGAALFGLPSYGPWDTGGPLWPRLLDGRGTW